jgi:hypothetical protein
VYAENRFSTIFLRSLDHHLTIESPRSHKSGIENIGSIRSSEDDHGLIAFKSVHFRQDLIQCLLSLVMPSTETRSAGPADGIDFVNEDDARSTLLSLIEKFPDSGCPDTDKEFDEFRSGDGKEGDFRFTCNGTG